MPSPAIALLGAALLTITGLTSLPSSQSEEEEAVAAASAVAPELMAEAAFQATPDGASFASAQLTIESPDAEPGTFAVEAPAASFELTVGGVSREAETSTTLGASVTESTSGAEVVAVPAADALRLQTVAGSPDEVESTSFTFAGCDLSSNSDGSVGLLCELGSGVWAPTGTIQPAWAFDANGDALSTTYEVAADGLLTQHVSVAPDTAYPVVADPTIVFTTPGSITVRYNRAETVAAYHMRGNATWIRDTCVAGGTALATAAGGPWVGIVGAVISSQYCNRKFNEAVTAIVSARNRGQCHQMTLYAGGWVSYGTYACVKAGLR